MAREVATGRDLEQSDREAADVGARKKSAGVPRVLNDPVPRGAKANATAATVASAAAIAQVTA